MAVEVPDEPPSSFLGEDEEDAEEEPQVEDPPEDPYPSVESSPETPKTPSSAVDPVLALLHAVKMKMPLSMHMQMFKKKHACEKVEIWENMLRTWPVHITVPTQS